jgi:hypothetical protein
MVILLILISYEKNQEEINYFLLLQNPSIFEIDEKLYKKMTEDFTKNF